MTDLNKLYENCKLCPRECGVNRLTGSVGYCGQTKDIRIARAALHYWEEPEISGTVEECDEGDFAEGALSAGSGAVFFSGCNMRCIYCQNHDISAMNNGYVVTPKVLSEEFLRLQNEGALNINLVTAAMHVPALAEALDIAIGNGLNIPVVYNSSGYESIDTLKILEDYVDIYLPDLKYLSSDLAGQLSGAPDYPEIATAAIEEMYRQSMSKNKKMIVRHLVLPNHTKESIDVIRYLYSQYGDDIYISIMSQYTPVDRFLDASDKSNEFPELRRRITKREYDKVVDFALDMGIKNAYIQERTVAKESFIPEFYMTL